jgi:arylsulfatase A-like enzyme
VGRPGRRAGAGYAAMITDLDRHVGAVLDALKKHGLEDNTLVIFTSDNGTTHPLKPNSHFNVGGVDSEFFNSLAGLRGFKGSLYEGGIRIPYIARFPGRIQAGTTSDFPTYFPDQFPTLCEIAGIPAPAGLDGISILPVLRGESAKVKRNPMVWVYPEYGGQVAVRIGDFKVMRTGINSKDPADWEVYDVVNDAKETTDLAAKQPRLIKKAKSILERQWDDSNPRYAMSKTKALE